MYKRVLVPLDGSRLAEQALPHAAAQAEQFGAEIYLLRVLGPLPDPILASRQVARSAEAASARLAQTYLEGIASSLRERGISAKAAIVEGKPYVEIIQFAEDEKIDLIVMSTRGHSGLSRWLLGSVADRVVRGATVPLMLIQARTESEGE
jgi:nucleotide-binding universal stress UspA family protein